MLAVTALTACSPASSTPEKLPRITIGTQAPTPAPDPGPSQEPVAPKAVDLPAMDTTGTPGQIQTLDLQLVANTVTAVSMNVKAQKNPNGSVDLTMSTADGSLLTGNLGAEVMAYQCTDGYSFNYAAENYQPAGGVFPRFENQNSVTVNMSAPTFTDHHAGCSVRTFQLKGDNMHSSLVLAGAPSFTV
jgi:hypothetical protein